MITFYDLGLSHHVIKAISDMGFEMATPIQEQTIPKALEGADLIGQAQTGTGKTAAFGIPLIETCDIKNNSVQCLVVAPTRELAMQVAEELNKLGQYKGVKTVPIYGGQDFQRQIRALKNNPSIIVSTPGRLLDHIRRRTIRLDAVKTIVLDEADEMLQMGFIEDIEKILEELPEERQTLLFSATMPPKIQALAQRFMNNPESIKVQSKEVTVTNIEQQYIELPEKQKFDALCRLLDIHSPELAIVFGRTKRRVDELAEALSKRGYDAEGIHGDLTQSKREQVLRKFKEKTIEVLVATDVAARGLDVSGVSHVFNFDIPQDPESYVHRVGRTGRAGKSGLAITFVTPREIYHLKTIENITKRKIDRHPVPSMSDVIEGKQRQAMDELLDMIESGDFKSYRESAEELLKDYDSTTVVSAALKILIKEPDTTPVTLTGEAPVRAKGPKKDFKQGGFSNRGKGSRSRNFSDKNYGGKKGDKGKYTDRSAKKHRDKKK
ncbi:DEAD/DEAH box helicase [Desulfuribacillus alkaliarsenatis]|uniref:ATP-dependent RNA helicase CshA n=1 Tax=Desulfuribacillus alkaliarsenatis TaxID=766136 RepID=A0A1E5G377_9FIRM|nr:DEAD/DEAH box helicase [Desulfuribacillus alkaliarsenatis]OEF97491.1 DEAD/DEAH box helicase [Desulfuribacillus alkaliarsenatis]